MRTFLPIASVLLFVGMLGMLNGEFLLGAIIFTFGLAFCVIASKIRY